MNPCSEFVLDDLMAVTAIPLSGYTDASYMASTVIPALNFEPVFDDDTIVIGKTRAMTVENGLSMTAGELIPIIYKSGKVKDTESMGVAGRSHSVTVDCEVDDRDSEVWPLLRRLEIVPRHLILTLRDGTRVFVWATQDSYQCSVTKGDGKTSVSFKVHNYMGMQLVA